jgi:predicted regulator of Ras-like GTPase activity (Roadblock/LC7/MglB family)
MEGQEARKKSIKAETLKRLIVNLRQAKAYKACGVLTFQGRILVRDSVDPNIDLDVVGATFNDIFQQAHEASERVGLEACHETAINTPKGIIIIRCSGIDAPAHFHLIVILGEEANLSLIRHELDRFLAVVMNEMGP